MNEDWPPGTVRYPDDTEPGGWAVVQPGHPHYSGALMLATEFWQRDHWQPIFSDPEPAPAGLPRR